MTVREIMYIKYKEFMKRVHSREWRNIEENAKANKRHPAEEVYSYLVITLTDIKNNGAYQGELWQEIDKMHKEKLIASNSHLGNSKYESKYWLTKKGLKALNIA